MATPHFPNSTNEEHQHVARTAGYVLVFCVSRFGQTRSSHNWKTTTAHDRDRGYIETPNMSVTEIESTRSKSAHSRTFQTARQIHCRPLSQVKCNGVGTRAVPVTIPGYTMGSVGLASLSRYLLCIREKQICLTREIKMSARLCRGSCSDAHDEQISPATKSREIQ